METGNALTRAIYELVWETCKPAEPGMAVIVTKNGETLFRAGRGMANLELGVPIEPDMVFRIGSITKQFTAVAILMLAEQGKLSVEDPITKVLPDYPVHDHLITIEHLLTHTSGIQSYTDMPASAATLTRKDFGVQEVINLFKDQPMQFSPGERYAYCNSGYFLLGAIIEKVTGRTYEQFIRQNIFDPLGMKRSYYDNPLRVIPRRVAGYGKGPNGYANAAYLSMTQPYAAGSLASTVDDLAIWDAALYAERMLKQETLRRAFTSYRLADGTRTDYGYGWAISGYEGRTMIEHGGGINGFRAYTIRIPDERVFVAVLSNYVMANPDLLAFKIAALSIGRPYKEPTAVVLNPDVLSRYEGAYTINAVAERHIVRDGDRLFSQVGQGLREELVPCSSNEFFFKANPLFHVTFNGDQSGSITSVETRGRSGIHELAMKVDTPAPAAS